MTTETTQQPNTGEVNPQQALSILIQAVNFAQSKGIFSLEDAAILDKAVKVFVAKKEPEQTPEQGEVSGEPEAAQDVVVTPEASN